MVCCECRFSIAGNVSVTSGYEVASSPGDSIISALAGGDLRPKSSDNQSSFSAANSIMGALGMQTTDQVSAGPQTGACLVSLPQLCGED